MGVIIKTLKALLLFILAGICIFYLTGGRFVLGSSVKEMDTQNFDNYKDIKALDIDLNLNEVMIEPSDEPMIEVEYPVYSNQAVQIKVNQEGDTLRITDSGKKFAHVDFPFFHNSLALTTVRIPKDYILDQMTFKLDMGSLSVSEVKSRQTALDLQMGSLTADYANLGALTADLNMGSIAFDEVELAGDSDLDLDMGSFDGSMKASKGTVKMKVSMGSVDLEMYDGNYKYLTDADMGDISVNNDGNSSQEYDAVIDIKASMGNVDIQ